jgi:4-carboxymuconolactone decarboxylase
MAELPPQPTGNYKALADFAPELVRITDDVLFGHVWERPALAKRDRSLATIAALVALRAAEQLPVHLKRGLANGLTREEIVEAITHLAFYSGWPSAMTAMNVARTVFEETPPPRNQDRR